VIPIIENEIVDVYRVLYDGGLNPYQIVDARERLHTLHHLILASEDSWPVKTCSCGRQHMASEWLKLPLVGYQSLPMMGGELRNCVCGSTLVLAPRRHSFLDRPRASILRHTIIGATTCNTRPPFSLQECMNISLAYSKMEQHIYFDKWTNMQVLEASLYGQTPECEF
jgi:hypothetical protein